jgi:hypothetical protein
LAENLRQLCPPSYQSRIIFAIDREIISAKGAVHAGIVAANIDSKDKHSPFRMFEASNALKYVANATYFMLGRPLLFDPAEHSESLRISVNGIDLVRDSAQVILGRNNVLFENETSRVTFEKHVALNNKLIFKDDIYLCDKVIATHSLFSMADYFPSSWPQRKFSQPS